MAGRILVLGSINTDFVVRGGRLPSPGETVLGGTFFEAAGGKGANQAVAAARLSAAPVTFIAAVGTDRLGDESLARLRQENLDCRYVRQVPDVASGVALILVDQHGENLISVASGANALLATEDIDTVPEECFAAAQVLLASLEVPLPTVARALSRAKQAGLTTILNPAPALRDVADSALLGMVDVLTPNEHELAALTDLSPTNDEQLIAAARVLQGLGARSLVVTLGSRGALVVDERAAWIEAARVTAVDSTAAGDAFSGALAVALGEGHSLLEAACWASLAGALAVESEGAQNSLPSRQRLESFAQRGLPAVR